MTKLSVAPQIVPERREIRPTADRGPILLCVDTSGSMRGPREVVAKALALECMRAAKAQERGCFVFAFAGPQEVVLASSHVSERLLLWSQRPGLHCLHLVHIILGLHLTTSKAG